MKNFKKILLTSVFASAMLLGAMMVFVPVTAVAGPTDTNCMMWNRLYDDDYACNPGIICDCLEEGKPITAPRPKE